MTNPLIKPKKKPRGRPFPKGASGNPGGRPKELAHIKEMARSHTESAIAALVEVLTNSDKGAERVAAAQALLDRAWGKPGQSLDIDANVKSTGPDLSAVSTDELMRALMGSSAPAQDDEEPPVQ